MKINIPFSLMVAPFLLAFVGGMLYLVYLACTNQPQLVREDYYQAGEKYQDQIDATRRAKSLVNPVTLRIKDSWLEISIPNSHPPQTGTFTLYRPSNAQLDKVFDFKDHASLQRFDLSKVVKGVYSARVNWTHNHLIYSHQQSLILF